MSRLSVFWPDADSEANILPFATIVARAKANQVFDVAAKAKVVHHNKTCVKCGRVGVEPLELNDTLKSAQGPLSPWSEAVVGFRCRHCRTEWSA